MPEHGHGLLAAETLEQLGALGRRQALDAVGGARRQHVTHDGRSRLQLHGAEHGVCLVDGHCFE